MGFQALIGTICGILIQHNFVKLAPLRGIQPHKTQQEDSFPDNQAVLLIETLLFPHEPSRQAAQCD